MSETTGTVTVAQWLAAEGEWKRIQGLRTRDRNANSVRWTRARMRATALADVLFAK